MSRQAAAVETNLREAAGRLLVAINQLTPAWTAINDSLPGFRADTLPEAFGGTGETDTPTDVDPATKALDDLTRSARRLFGEATTIYSIVTTWAAPPRKGKASEGNQTEDWCSNHLHIGLIEPRYRGDLCRWCYDVHAVEGVLPPPVLLRARQRGDRITAKDMTAALGTRSKRKNLKRAKARARRRKAG